MKRLFILTVAGLIGFSFPLTGMADPTPSDAQKTGLRVLERFEKVATLATGEEVLGMVGFYGNPQPGQWLILTADPTTPGILRESVFSGGKVLAERNFRMLIDQDLPEIPLNRKAILIDSDVAFQVVEEIARSEKRTFETAHFQLRNRKESNEPIWMISLINRAQVPQGTLYISAKTGKLVRSAWINPLPKVDPSISLR